MSDLLKHRRESFRYECLDLEDNVLYELPASDPFTGVLDFSVYATIRGSGNGKGFAPHISQAIDWLTHRMRVSYLLEGQEPVPLITAIPRAPVEQYTAFGVSETVELYDKTLILQDDTFGVSYSVAAGANIIEAVADVITSTGESAPDLLTPSEETLAAGMVWEAGVSKLKIANDLLNAAGYFALYTDGLGRFRADPYTTPSSRPVEWVFEGEQALYLHDWTRDMDLFSVPNRYICVGRADGDTPALTSTATDEGTGRFSFSSRGRWITRAETDVEAASQSVLDLIAQRKLYEAQQVTESFEFVHPYLPFGLNSVVEFNGTRCVVWKQSVMLQTGGLITSTARRLVEE